MPQIREGMLRKRKDVDNGSPSESAWAGHVYNLGASTLCPPLSLTPPRWSPCQFSAKHVPLGFIKKYLEWIRIWNLGNTNWCNVLFNCIIGYKWPFLPRKNITFKCSPHKNYCAYKDSFKNYDFWRHSLGVFVRCRAEDLKQ